MTVVPGTRRLNRTWSQPIGADAIAATTSIENTKKEFDDLKCNDDPVDDSTSNQDNTSPSTPPPEEESPSRSVRRIKNLKEFRKLTKNPQCKAEETDCDPSTEEENKPTGSCNPLAPPSVPRRCFSDSDAPEVPVYDGGDTDVWGNPLVVPLGIDESKISPDDPSMTIICDEEPPAAQVTEAQPDPVALASEGTAVMASSVQSCEEVLPSGSSSGWQVAVSGTGGTTPPGPATLPPPEDFGGGNPFLMFLCLSLLLQQRSIIMGQGMDHNDLAMHFDRLVRKHPVHPVLAMARRMFHAYRGHYQRGTNNTSLRNRGGGSGGGGASENTTTDHAC